MNHPEVKLEYANAATKKWLTQDFSSIVVHVSEDAKRKENAIQFCQAGTPALFKTHTGFVAEMGDIQVCLSMSLNATNGEVTGSVCQLNPETGEMTTRMEKKGDDANLVFQAFVMDFPKAVLTTEDMKPLCLFKGKGKGRMFVGYLSFEEFLKTKRSGVKELSIGVP